MNMSRSEKNGAPHFIKFSAEEWVSWFETKPIRRKISFVQVHHTYRPAYPQFKGDNHFQLQSAMRQYHMRQNGWRDIGQHLTLFPDGALVTGRDFDMAPACIFGQNTHGICLEVLGNFDLGMDVMSREQARSLLLFLTSLCKRFNWVPGSDRIVYHHWYDLKTGNRTEDKHKVKSCPGSGFWGGNEEEDLTRFLIPDVIKTMELLKSATADAIRMGYAMIRRPLARVYRKSAGFNRWGRTSLALDRGTIVPLYAFENNRFRISVTESHWIAGGHLLHLRRGVVKAIALNGRSGPGTSFPVERIFQQNESLYLLPGSDDWVFAPAENVWVSRRFIAYLT
jgi:hypothetical protein